MTETSGGTNQRRKIRSIGDGILGHPDMRPLDLSRGVAVVVPAYLIEVVHQLVIASSLNDIVLPPGTVVADTFVREDPPALRKLAVKDSPDLAAIGFNNRRRSLEVSLMYGYVSGKRKPYGRLSQIIGVTLDPSDRLLTYRRVAAAVGALAVELSAVDSARPGLEADIDTFAAAIHEISYE